ncbi:type II secretion system protein [Candidatus Magnetaquicoccus inordinatus]|uniref:type II secretion system protein n=1 Tax=Candidatus Magnetaquicoccus inordinatus TaxID=2496818 RepID=UPI00102B8776|nr:hypothetical protein [Candidatus Magnetaquicoccus inordinatus]
MKQISCQQGVSLIELLLWIIVISLTATGIIPLFLQVLNNLQRPMEAVQAHFLAQAAAACSISS